MNRNYWPIWATGCIAALSWNACAADHPLMGEWFPQSTSKGGLGATKSYDTNGTVVVGFGAAVHLPYKVETNTIVLQDSKGPAPRMGFTITNNTLTLREGQGPKQKLTRVSGTDTQSLVGKWTGGHYTGRQQVMDFTTNMNCYLSVPFQSVTGTFVIDGDTLKEELQNKRTTWNWKIADGVLTLTEPSGPKTEKYKRKY
jgi:hypothetical protein